MKVKLPASIEMLPDGPHKKDLIKEYKKRLRRNAKNRRKKD